MKMYYFLIIVITILFSGCDKTTGVYKCIKNETSYDIKIEQVRKSILKEYSISSGEEVKAFYVSSDFETFPSETDTFYIFINNKKYMDTYNLSTSLTHLNNYVLDKTKETRNTSYYIFNVNENYINSLIEMK